MNGREIHRPPRRACSSIAPLREARRAVERARSRCSDQGALVRRAIERLARLIGQAATVVDQIGKRVRDERITDRFMSFADP